MSVVIIGTLDTKGEEIGFARDVVEDHGLDVHVIDTGVLGDSMFEADTTCKTVAEFAGESLQTLRDEADRGHAMEVMGNGAAVAVKQLHDEGELDGVLSMGGSSNTSIATTAMRALPYGVPKLVVSTMASGDTRPYIESRDIMMLHSVADIEGLNQFTRRIISNAALAMVGMVSNDFEIDSTDRLTIGVTMFGVTTPCVQQAREYLEELGYEVLVFHATGTGGQAMENLIEQGLIDGVLDVTTTEWADELVGGVLSAGPNRLEAASEMGIPQVVSTGALDMVNFGPIDAVPAEFKERTLHRHNPTVTLMRTTPEENAELGRILAEKLNRATGPTAVALPLEGVSMIDTEGEDFHHPEADERLFDAIREYLSEDIELIERDTAINDETFALTMARTLDEFMQNE